MAPTVVGLQAEEVFFHKMHMVVPDSSKLCPGGMLLQKLAYICFGAFRIVALLYHKDEIRIGFQNPFHADVFQQGGIGIGDIDAAQIFQHVSQNDTFAVLHVNGRS